MVLLQNCTYSLIFIIYIKLRLLFVKLLCRPKGSLRRLASYMTPLYIELILMRGSKTSFWCLLFTYFCKNSFIIFFSLFSPDSCISLLMFPAHGLSLHNAKVRGLPTTHTLNIPSQFLALTTFLLGFYTSCGKTTLFNMLFGSLTWFYAQKAFAMC